MFITGDFGTKRKLLSTSLHQFLLLENPRLASIHQCSISAHQSEGKPLEQVPRCHSLITSLDTTPWTFLCTAAAATVERM